MKYYYIIDDALARRGFLDIKRLNTIDKDVAIITATKDWLSMTEIDRNARDYYAVGESDDPDVVNPDKLKIIKVLKG